MPALDTLNNASMKTTVTWSAEKNVTGYNPILHNGSISKTISFSSGTNNDVAGGADQVVSYILTIAGGGSSTLDLRSLTNVVGATANFARVKGYQFRLLDPTDDATNGTNCTGVVVGNSGANAALLGFGAAAHTMQLKPGGVIFNTDRSAAGFTVNATTKDLLFTNSDGTNAAAIQVTFFGGED